MAINPNDPNARVLAQQKRRFDTLSPGGPGMVSSHGPGSGAPPTARPQPRTVTPPGPRLMPRPAPAPPGRRVLTPPGRPNLPPGRPIPRPMPKPIPKVATPPGRPNLPPGPMRTPPGPGNLPPQAPVPPQGPVSMPMPPQGPISMDPGGMAGGNPGMPVDPSGGRGFVPPGQPPVLYGDGRDGWANDPGATAGGNMPFDGGIQDFWGSPMPEAGGQNSPLFAELMRRRQQGQGF